VVGGSAVVGIVRGGNSGDPWLSRRDHALACLLALNGLRISEALNADIEHLGRERGHRTLTFTRKGGKVATIPLAPRTARAIDLCVGEREEGPIFLNRDGTRRLDRHDATRIVKRLSRRAGIEKTISPHSLPHSFITAALDAGFALRDVQEAASHADPRTTMRYERARRSLDRHATYVVATFVVGASRWTPSRGADTTHRVSSPRRTAGSARKGVRDDAPGGE
jgi:integrase